VDDLSRYIWVATIPSNDCVVAAIKVIQARAEGESGLKLKALRTDRGGEFTAIEFVDYCAAEGVHCRASERDSGGNRQEHAKGQRPTRMVLG
jgi:hypothetical protein